MKRTVLITMIFIGILVGSFSMSGCYYDVEEELYGNNCDTTAVTYSGTISGLMTTYGCKGCHLGGSPPAGVNVETHANIKTNISRIWGAINHHSGFKPMPDGGPKMNQCDLNKFGAWMNAGAPNN